MVEAKILTINKKLVKELRSEHVLKNRKVLINAIEDIGIRIFQDFQIVIKKRSLVVKY